MKIWSKIAAGIGFGLTIATFSFGCAMAAEIIDDFGESIGDDVMLVVNATNEQAPAPQATAQEETATRSRNLFGYSDILIISLIDYSPSGTQLLVSGNVVIPKEYDEEGLPTGFTTPDAVAVESGVRLVTFGASLLQGRQKMNVIKTGADSRFTFGIVNGRTQPPVIGVDGIKLDIKSCLKDGQTGLALVIFDDKYIHRPSDTQNKGPKDFRIKEIAFYPDAYFWPGRHSLEQTTELTYDSDGNDYYCKK